MIPAPPLSFPVQAKVAEVTSVSVALEFTPTIETVGAVVSTVKASGAVAVLSPAALAAVAVRAWAPSARAPIVRLQVPSAAATAVPRVVEPSLMVTVEPASAVPVRVCAAVFSALVTRPSAAVAERSVGVAGAVPKTSMFNM